MGENNNGDDKESTETERNQQSLEIGSVGRSPLSNLSSSSILDAQDPSGVPDVRGDPRTSGRTDHVRHSSLLAVKRRRRGCCDSNDDCLRVYAVIPRIFSVIAFALSLTVLLDCRLLRLQQSFVATKLNETYGEQAKFYFGLYQYAGPLEVEYGNGSRITIYDAFNDQLSATLKQNVTVEPEQGHCTPYPEDYEVTPEHKAARAFAVTAVILGGFMMIVLWFECCCLLVCSVLCPNVLVSATLLIVLPVVQGLAMIFDDQVCSFTLVSQSEKKAIEEGWTIVTDEYSCGVDRRGAYYPASIALWIICGILFTCIKPRAEDDLPYFSSGPLNHS